MGFCEREAADTDGIVTFVHSDRVAVDDAYDRLQAYARGPPVENDNTTATSSSPTIRKAAPSRSRRSSIRRTRSSSVRFDRFGRLLLGRFEDDEETAGERRRDLEIDRDRFAAGREGHGPFALVVRGDSRPGDAEPGVVADELADR